MAVDAPDNPPEFLMFDGSSGCDICAASTCVFVAGSGDEVTSAHYNCGCSTYGVDSDCSSEIKELSEERKSERRMVLTKSYVTHFPMERQVTISIDDGSYDNSSGDSDIWDAIDDSGWKPRSRDPASATITIPGDSVTSVRILIWIQDSSWTARREWTCQPDGEAGPEVSVGETAQAAYARGYRIRIESVKSSRYVPPNPTI